MSRRLLLDGCLLMLVQVFALIALSASHRYVAVGKWYLSLAIGPNKSLIIDGVALLVCAVLAIAIDTLIVWICFQLFSFARQTLTTN